MHDAYESTLIKECAMQKRITITMDEAVYDGLMRVVGRGKVSQFLESLARRHVLDTALDEGYAAMSRDLDREKRLPSGSMV